MIQVKRAWMLALLALAACGRSPLQDGTGTLAVVRMDAGLPPCASGLTQCGRRNVSLCHDLSRSRDNCGACGNACAPGIACSAGTCQQVRCQGPLTFRSLDVIKADSTYLSYPYRPALGDFDGDGILDLAGIAEITDPGGILAGAKVLSGTRLLYGAGDGTFPTAARIETSPIQNWRNLSADLDGDGHLDLVSIRESHPDVAVRRGSGERGSPFGAATAYPTSQDPDSLLVADLDSDGHLDLVAGVASNLEHWRGLGDGRFEHRATLSSRGSAPILQTVDWNHDGALDLVFGSSNLHLRYGRGDGTFDPEVVCGLGFGGPTFAPLRSVADLDRNGAIDMALPPTGVFMDLDGCNPGKFIPLVDWGIGSSPSALELVDLNGDGNLDILPAMPQRVYLGDGKGGFAPSPLSMSGGMFLVGDLNRDGRLDVITSTDQGWQVRLNTCQ